MNEQSLNQLGFQEAAMVFVRDGVPDAVFNDFGQDVTAGVYCWISEDTAGNQEVIYVGKFGSALPKRFREHRGGFRGGSQSGVKKAAYIFESLDQGNTIKIFAKASARCDIEYTDILGNTIRTTVTTESTDEISMIEHVTAQQGKPVLNGTKGG